jgi:hypothetical protein
METALPTPPQKRSAPQRCLRDLRVLQRVMQFGWMQKSAHDGFVATVQSGARTRCRVPWPCRVR